jgi:hypothetical protein
VAVGGAVVGGAYITGTTITAGGVALGGYSGAVIVGGVAGIGFGVGYGIGTIISEIPVGEKTVSGHIGDFLYWLCPAPFD